MLVLLIGYLLLFFYKNKGIIVMAFMTPALVFSVGFSISTFQSVKNILGVNIPFSSFSKEEYSNYMEKNQQSLDKDEFKRNFDRIQEKVTNLAKK